MKKYEIPVYLFTGFLEAGKTSYIQKSLQDPEFCGKERILLLVCEEGFEEYNKAQFCGDAVTIEVLEQVEDISKETLANLVNTHQADKVLIEYNGMWSLGTLKTAMPENWRIYQEFFLADSGSFMTYNANMRQLVYEKLKDCSCTLFNRFDTELMDRMDLHRIVRAANTRCYIFYESPDGRTEVDTIQDPLPFDTEADVIDIWDEHFALWYRDLCENPRKYQGRTVRWKGLVSRGKQDSGEFIAGREMMFCCMDDLIFASFLCKWNGELPAEKTWITMNAKAILSDDDVTFMVESLNPAEEPTNAIATFY